MSTKSKHPYRELFSSLKHLPFLFIGSGISRRYMITTNFDMLPEEVFKGYSTFVGQEQLLFGATQGVSEIYKIHGCCTEPKSLIITAKDYEDFDRRNAYLAAKLLTIFVEHPIIFIGYSLSDTNIQSILAAIIDCLSDQNLQVLKQRMIFVEYSGDPDQVSEISEHSVSFKGGTRSIKMILPRKTVRGSLKKETRNGKNTKQVCAALRPRI